MQILGIETGAFFQYWRIPKRPGCSSIWYLSFPSLCDDCAVHTVCYVRVSGALILENSYHQFHVSAWLKWHWTMLCPVCSLNNTKSLFSLDFSGLPRRMCSVCWIRCSISGVYTYLYPIFYLSHAVRSGYRN